MRIEQSRKHGPFDPRFPVTRHKPAPASLWRVGENTTDWEGFLARFFSERGRHDFEVLAAYESYMNDVEGRLALGSLAPRSLPGAADAARSDTTQRSEAEEPPATADTERWDGEGGASAGRRRRVRAGQREFRGPAVGVSRRVTR